MLREIDPDGDLLITLTPSAEPFADESLFIAENGAESNLVQAFNYEPEQEILSPDDTVTEPEVTRNESMTEFEEIEEPFPRFVQFKVSSKNMASASKRFKQMLSGPWLEATTSHADGLRHVEMEGFDTDAFNIVMNLIHGLNRKDQVPRKVGFEMLGKIAIVVDDLGCHNAVALASEIWLAASRPTLDASTKEYNRTMIISLLISCVFADSTTFEDSVRTAIWESTGPIPTMGLPIPGKVADAISAKRDELIGSAIDKLYLLLESLGDGFQSSETYPQCNHRACQCMLLGSLMLGMREMGLSKRPQQPYTGRTLKELVKSMVAIDTPAWHRDKRATRHACNIQDRIPKTIAGLRSFLVRDFANMFPNHPLLYV